MIPSPEHSFYAAHTETSSPGGHADLLGPPSVDPSRVAAAVPASWCIPSSSPARRSATPHDAARDAQVRDAREILHRLVDRDARPLDAPRPIERRVVGTCRNYSLLAAAVFRRHGVPARLRVGFAVYFLSAFHEDHWVCEYADGDSWRLLDAEPGESAVARDYAIDFPPWDVPRDRFVTAGDAWGLLRVGAIDPDACGVSFIPPVRGA